VKRLRLVLLAALAAVVVGTLLAYWINPPAKLPVSQEDVSSILLDQDGRPYVRGLTYTQVREGTRKWTLSAESARYDEGQGFVTLDKVTIDYFPDKGGPMVMVGDTGDYDQRHQLVNIRGNVRGSTADGITLKTDHLAYAEVEQTVETDSWVTIKGARFSVTGKGMLAVVPNNTVTFKSQVSCTFIPSGKGPPPGTTIEDANSSTPAGGKQ
jgi:LPS export ABC transporter protein LptC